MLLEMKNVSFRYDKKTPWILENISFSISNTERIGLIAPSGFGKTTLCKLLAGYEMPTQGEILLDTKPLPKKGYCPVQMIWQHPEMAVNTKLPMKKILEEGGSISEEMIAKLGIQRQWFSRFAQTLSGGELQRFCIARALAGNPSFFRRKIFPRARGAPQRPRAARTMPGGSKPTRTVHRNTRCPKSG